MKPTTRQINKLIYEMERSPRTSIQKIWNRIPRNNKTYHDKRADYRRAIFEDWLMDRATKGQVDYLITLVCRGYMAYKIKDILRQINKQKQ